VVVNADLIEYIETTPDAIISMTNGQKLTVRAVDEVLVLVEGRGWQSSAP
jgi:uncharacterized protein YlzI (FlbEa/FlbD family)